MRMMLFFVLFLLPGQLSAKGLDALSDEAPTATDEQPPSGEPETPNEPPPTAEPQVGPGPGLYIISTSFGWVRANKSTGKWTTSGASDLGVARKIDAPLPLPIPADLYLTYRYLPIAFSGHEGSRYYSGTWEHHLFGAEARASLYGISGVAKGEMGLVAEHRRPSDGLPTDEKGRKMGIALALGAGPEYAFLDGGALKVGGRLNLAIGTVKSVQLAVTTGFTF